MKILYEQFWNVYLIFGKFDPKISNDKVVVKSPLVQRYAVWRAFVLYTKAPALITFLSVIILLMLCGYSCRERATEPTTVSIQLTAEDVAVTEVWLKLSLPAGITPRTVTLKRDTLNILSTELQSEDTLILDEGLFPKHTYKYTLTRTLPLGFEEKKTVTVMTMDTTSHNFTWQIDTLGDGASSVLRDVAIINDTCVWAVGEIYKKDSTGQFETDAYNAAKWDGKKWTLIRIPTRIWNTNAYMYAPLQSVYAFSENNICVTTGGQVIWYNGQNWGNWQFLFTSLDDPTFGGINKFWGTSKTNLYGVGNKGSIFFYNGSSWRRMELPPLAGQGGTELDIYDIYGDKNIKTSQYEIYAVAAKQFVTFDRRILRITPSGATTVSDSSIPYSLHGVWFKGGGPYYVVGSGMYHKYDATKPGAWQWLHPGLTPYYIYAIRGNDVNDIVFCGSYGELLHFNGVGFRSYQSMPGFSALEFYEISCRDNLVVAVGYVQPRAVAVIERRTP